MPSRICALERSVVHVHDRVQDTSSMKMSSHSNTQAGKAVRFTEKVDFQKIEKRFKNPEFASTDFQRQSVALALDSLRIVCTSEDDIQRDLDLESPSKDSNGKITCGSHVRFFVEKIFRPWTNNPVALAHFRSTFCMRNELQRQRETNRYCIHPFSLFRLIWDVLMIVVLFVTILVLPVEVAFYSNDLWDPNWKAFNLIVDAVFIIDICINMKTGYVINQIDEIILDSKAIIKNYLKSWFVIDLISSIPMDYIVLSITGEDQAVLASTLRALRMVKFLSLLRILRFIRLIRYLGRMKEFMNVDAKILSILRLVMSILVFAHWNACIQYFILYLQGFPENCWLKISGLDNDNVTRWSIYSHAIYRGMSHMISIGYGKSPPDGNSETWTVIVSMMMGATFYAMFIAHVSAIVMSLDASGRHFNEKVCEVKDYMRFRRLPANLQQRVIDYFEYKYQQKLFDEHAILDERYLSYPLRKEIVMHNCRSLVQSVPFLRDSPSEFLVEVILKLNMHVYFPGDHIIQAGKKGDCMYFIEHGMVNVILSDGLVVNSLKDGSHFGEVSLLFDEKRIADVVSVETSYIYRLAKSDFDQVLDEYPNMRVEMIKVARYRLEQTQAKLGFAKAGTEVDEDDIGEEVIQTDGAETTVKVTPSEEAWIMDEAATSNVSNANNNNNNNRNNSNGPNNDSANEVSQDQDETNLSMNNNASWEDSGTPYLDCSSGDDGPMVFNVIDGEEDDDSSEVVISQWLTDHRYVRRLLPTVEEETYNSVYSMVDQVAETSDEKKKANMVETAGLRKRCRSDEDSTPRMASRV